ncbi:hypothetical protein A2U01_0010739 [Trifolium medium]|uniref:Uncharacterized protein n=1 Tax=Trifolium medium TaxID=97028 RepID=A0A392MQR0_9FABA|nr:hypothetical protein [Trifolium medium]
MLVGGFYLANLGFLMRGCRFYRGLCSGRNRFKPPLVTDTAMATSHLLQDRVASLAARKPYTRWATS